MTQKEYTVIHAVSDVLALNRAGQAAGKTSVARLAGITIPRVSKVLISALKLGLLYSYRDAYRPDIVRQCYAVTDTGIAVNKAIDKHIETTIWRQSNE